MLLTAAASAETASFRIGVCQLEQHAALADATRGFMDAIAQNLGDQCEVAVQNASGDPATCITIANSFISANVDLIMANATPALQAAYAATGDTPILGVAVTDYPTALDPRTADKVLTLSRQIIEENNLMTMMVTHNMRDAIAYGNRLIMMHEGKVILDIAGEEKKKLTVENLLEQFARVSGDGFVNDRVLLS